MLKKNLLALSTVLLPFSVAAGVIDGMAAFVRADYARAEKELTPEARTGNAQAQVLLARIYLINSVKKNDAYAKEAVKYLRMAAEQGDNEARVTLGTVFLTENEVALGLGFLTLAASENYLPATILLALYYKAGIYVDQDYKRAAELYEQGAKALDAGSMFELAEMYDNGYGVEKNPSKAFYLAYTAASTTNPYAQFLLGLAYENASFGLKKDMNQANHWYRAAARQGNYLAKEALARLGVKQ